MLTNLWMFLQDKSVWGSDVSQFNPGTISIFYIPSSIIYHLSSIIYLSYIIYRLSSSSIFYSFIHSFISLLLLDRFHLNPELKKHPQYAPFGIGVRICAGRNLANVELRLVAAHFFHHFAVHTAGGRPVNIVEGTIYLSINYRWILILFSLNSAQLCYHLSLYSWIQQLIFFLILMNYLEYHITMQPRYFEIGITERK